MSSRIFAATGALVIALLAPVGAQAATIEPLKPCYVTAGTVDRPQAEGVAIRASGFTPNSKVTLAIDGQVPTDGTGLQTDVSGNLVVPETFAPWIAAGSREFTVALTEEGNEANTATATARTTALDVSVRPAEARPSRRVRFRGSGFTLDRPVYAHYLYKRKLRKTVRMTRHPGVCGDWKVRRPQIPIDDPKPGRWIVQFDQVKRYEDPAQGTLDSVFVRLRIDVTLSRAGG